MSAVDFKVQKLTMEQRLTEEDAQLKVRQSMKKEIVFGDEPSAKFQQLIKAGTIGKMIDDQMKEMEEEKERKKQAKREAEEIERLTYADVKGKDWMVPVSQLDRNASQDEVICEELDDDESDTNSVSDTIGLTSHKNTTSLNSAGNTLSSKELFVCEGKRTNSPARIREDKKKQPNRKISE